MKRYRKKRDLTRRREDFDLFPLRCFTISREAILVIWGFPISTYLSLNNGATAILRHISKSVVLEFS